MAKHDETSWAGMVGRCRVAVEKSDAWGLHRFLAMFAGMGSLNDLVLQRDGTMLTTENDALREMLTKAWTLATKLQRDDVAQARGE
ncbi:DUF6966 domain-containing protein [Ensifer adhaerens]|uniref:DUF6966 domain-containing protein n=1 Tax=Ensifer adhaerens TaxID=106592 RepID=UPI003D039467